VNQSPGKGYYFTEKDLVDLIKANVAEGNTKDFKTIECSVMDIADNIAYSTYDLEDSLKGGFINPLKILAFDNKFKQVIIDKVNKEIKKTYKDEFDDQELNINSFNNIIITTFEGIFAFSESMIDRFKNTKTLDSSIFAEISIVGSAEIASASVALCENGYLRGEFTSKLVTEFMGAIKAEPNQLYQQLSLVNIDIKTFKKVEILKTICYQSIISSPRLKMAERRGFRYY
jgi:dGTPase